MKKKCLNQASEIHFFRLRYEKLKQIFFLLPPDCGTKFTQNLLKSTLVNSRVSADSTITPLHSPLPFHAKNTNCHKIKKNILHLNTTKTKTSHPLSLKIRLLRTLIHKN